MPSFNIEGTVDLVREVWSYFPHKSLISPTVKRILPPAGWMNREESLNSPELRRGKEDLSVLMISLKIFGRLFQFHTGLIEFGQRHRPHEHKPASRPYKRARMLVEVFPSETHFQLLILFDLNLLCEFGKRPVKFVTWEGCRSLRCKSVHE
jgi:hypothetical protein